MRQSTSTSGSHVIVTACHQTPPTNMPDMRGPAILQTWHVYKQDNFPWSGQIRLAKTATHSGGLPTCKRPPECERPGSGLALPPTFVLRARLSFGALFGGQTLVPRQHSSPLTTWCPWTTLPSVWPLRLPPPPPPLPPQHSSSSEHQRQRIYPTC